MALKKLNKSHIKSIKAYLNSEEGKQAIIKAQEDLARQQKIREDESNMRLARWWAQNGNMPFTI